MQKVSINGAHSVSKQNLIEESDSMTESWFTRFESALQPIRIRSKLGRSCLAEFIGMFVFVMFHSGSIAQSTLSGSSFLNINWGGGVGLFLGVYFSAGISGGHLNPAVSLGFTLLGKLKLSWLLFYTLSQLFGAFCASVFVYGVYVEAIDNFDHGNRTVVPPGPATAGIFATYPQEFLSLQSGLFDQIVGTALLMGSIAAVTDERNSKPVKGMEPYIIGFILFGVGLSYGYNCGYSLNPAKDLGPRLFSYFIYGPEVWTPYGIQWWWVPIVGPLIGGSFGAIIYFFFVQLHHPPAEDDPAKYVQFTSNDKSDADA